MKHERITSYVLSKKISKTELKDVSAAATTALPTFQTTYTDHASDTVFDIEMDAV